MKRFIPILVIASTALTLPATARAATLGEVQLLQPGDSAKSCEALATEINALALAEAKPAKKKKKGFGLGSLTQALSMASPMLGNIGGGMGGAIASQAIGAAQSSAMQSQAQESMDSAMAAMNPNQSIEAQRKARLMGFFESKGC